MKRYHVFAGYDYEASGGYHDFRAGFTTKMAAIKYMREIVEKTYDWAHVVDVLDERIIEDI